MSLDVFKVDTIQIDRINGAINLLGLREYVNLDADISIDSEMRAYKIALVLPSEAMVNIPGDSKGVTLTIPIMPDVDLGMH